MTTSQPAPKPLASPSPDVLQRIQAMAVEQAETRRKAYADLAELAARGESLTEDQLTELAQLGTALNRTPDDIRRDIAHMHECLRLRAAIGDDDSPLQKQLAKTREQVASASAAVERAQTELLEVSHAYSAAQGDIEARGSMIRDFRKLVQDSNRAFLFVDFAIPAQAGRIDY